MSDNDEGIMNFNVQLDQSEVDVLRSMSEDGDFTNTIEDVIWAYVDQQIIEKDNANTKMQKVYLQSWKETDKPSEGMKFYKVVEE